MSGNQVNSHRSYNLAESERVTLTIRPEVLMEIDRLRGKDARNRWIVDACKMRLAGLEIQEEG